MGAVRVRGSFRARTFGLIATSSAAHIVVFSALGLIPSPAEVLAREEMEFEVVEPPKPPPPPPKEEPPEEEKKAPVPQRAAPKAEPEPPPEEAPPPTEAPAEEVADFTGTTLTAEGGGGWSSVVGRGGALKGPVGKIATGPQPVAAAKPAAVGPRVVALSSLTRKPKPPGGLDRLLEQHYPQRARMQGVEGQAVVQFRVLASGTIGEIKVLEEFPPGFGFGAACRDMLRQSGAWTSGLDGGGNPVATDIPKFPCRFVVAD